MLPAFGSDRDPRMLATTKAQPPYHCRYGWFSRTRRVEPRLTVWRPSGQICGVSRQHPWQPIRSVQSQVDRPQEVGLTVDSRSRSSTAGYTPLKPQDLQALLLRSSWPVLDCGYKTVRNERSGMITSSIGRVYLVKSYESFLTSRGSSRVFGIYDILDRS
ncbi:hypothetical protein J6590_008589 [Homalodisca vitripennis]|nr:hypothetical protein J6590_008589 [Homalodisca vitripennis]